MVREIAGRAHAHPDGEARRYSRGTIDRWIRAHRSGGMAALAPAARSDTGVVRAHPELAGEAAALRLELPGRSAGYDDPHDGPLPGALTPAQLRDLRDGVDPRLILGEMAINRINAQIDAISESPNIKLNDWWRGFAATCLASAYLDVIGEAVEPSRAYALALSHRVVGSDAQQTLALCLELIH